LIGSTGSHVNKIPHTAYSVSLNVIVWNFNEIERLRADAAAA